MDTAVPSDSNIEKKDYEKLEKYQGLKEELGRTWKVKAKVVPVVTGALGAVTPKLEERLQHEEQHQSSLMLILMMLSLRYKKNKDSLLGPAGGVCVFLHLGSSTRGLGGGRFSPVS